MNISLMAFLPAFSSSSHNSLNIFCVFHMLPSHQSLACSLALGKNTISDAASLMFKNVMLEILNQQTKTWEREREWVWG